MPYIDPEDYARAEKEPANVGELNFAVTKELISYTQRKGLRYGTINDVMGAVASAEAFFATMRGPNSIVLVADMVAPSPPVSKGDLATVLTILVARYAVVEMNKGVREDIQIDTAGALRGAGAEFYRRVAAPYEDVKIVANGDVYPPELLTPPVKKNCGCSCGDGVVGD